jgi:2-iminobutanoate/2-iminopropanoate deaminase
MPSQQIISTPDAPTMTGAQAMRAGNTLYLSGQGPLDPVTKAIVSPDIGEQTRQTLKNIHAVLRAAGADWHHAVNMRVFLRDVKDFPEFQKAYLEIMGTARPTRTTIGGIPHPAGMNIEIECVALLD